MSCSSPVEPRNPLLWRCYAVSGVRLTGLDTTSIYRYKNSKHSSTIHHCAVGVRASASRRVANRRRQ